MLLLVGRKIYHRHLLHKLITYHTIKETNNEYCLQTPICTVSVCILSRKLFTSSQTAVDKTAVIYSPQTRTFGIKPNSSVHPHTVSFAVLACGVEVLCGQIVSQYLYRYRLYAVQLYVNWSILYLFHSLDAVRKLQIVFHGIRSFSFFSVKFAVPNLQCKSS